MEEDVEIELLLKSNEEMLMREAAKLREDERESSIVSNTINSDDEGMNYNDEVQELLDDHIVSYMAKEPTKHVSQLHSLSSDDENDRSEYESDGDQFINEIMSQSEQYGGSFMEHVKKVIGNKDSQIKYSAISELTSAHRMIIERENLLKSLELKFQEKLYSIEENIQYTRESITSLSDHTVSKMREPSYSRSYFRKFGAPYFKDAHGFCPSPNADHASKLKTDQTALVFIENPCYWTKDHQKKLTDAIKETLTVEKSDKLIKEIRKMKEMFVEAPEKKNDNLLLEKLAKYQQELNSIKNKSFEELICDENQDREFDWMRYSVYLFDGEHSPDECKRFWNVYLKPGINKSSWEYAEDLRLLDIAEQMEFQDWNSIAQLLGTNRSAYQCFVHFQTRLNAMHDFSKGKWTKEEDKKLLDVINASRIGNFIPWTKVSCHMTNRNHTQIYNRFKKSLDPKLIKGRFTRGEDLLIVAGVEVFGCNFKELSSLLSNRSCGQIRERYDRYLLPKYRRVGTWSLEEDQQLIRLVEKHGEQNWAEISRVMKIRTRTQTRQRYRFIQQNMKTKAGWSINNIKRRKIHITDKSLERTKRNVEKIKEEIKQVERAFNLTKIEKDTFRIEKLKELRDSVLMKPYKSRRRKKMPADCSNVNKLLDDFFKNNQIKAPELSKVDNFVDYKHYFDELNMLAMNLGYELQIPGDEDEILNNPRLSNSLKNVLLESIQSKTFDRSVQSNEDSTPTFSGSYKTSIDYIPPESDSSIIINECWFNPPIDVSRLNFTELFKSTVFDYSCGMHRDIWKTKIKQSTLINSSSFTNDIHEPPSTERQLYNLPPNLLTTLCFKSALLSRARLRNDCGKEDNRNLSLEENERNNDVNSDVDINSYLDVFQESLLTLFTWPRALFLSSMSNANTKASAETVSCQQNIKNKNVTNLSKQSHIKANKKPSQVKLKQTKDIKRENLLVKKETGCKRKMKIEHLLPDVKNESHVNPHLFNEVLTTMHSKSTVSKKLGSNNENISPANHFIFNKSKKSTVNHKTSTGKKLPCVKENTGMLKSSVNTNKESKEVLEQSPKLTLQTYRRGKKRKIDSNSISDSRKKSDITSSE